MDQIFFCRPEQDFPHAHPCTTGYHARERAACISGEPKSAPRRNNIRSSYFYLQIANTFRSTDSPRPLAFAPYRRFVPVPSVMVLDSDYSVDVVEPNFDLQCTDPIFG